MARKIHRLNDRAIRQLVTAAKPFEMADGSGLWLRLREGAGAATFRFRYRYGGKAHVMFLGNYGDGGLSLKAARDEANKLSTNLTKKIDIAEEARKRKAEAIAKVAAADNVYRVKQLADEFYKRKIQDKVKHPKIVLARIKKDIKPNIGEMAVTDVRPTNIRKMLETVAKRTKTVANDVLRVTLRIFNEAVKDGVIEYNPAAAFDTSDAGGEEKARDRALARDELVKFFAAMRKTQGLSPENEHTFKLLMLLAVRKGELVMARTSEFDLKAAIWELPGERTKTGAPIDIPLSSSAVAALRKLVDFGDGSDYLLPARKSQKLELPYIHENTLNVALSKVRKVMGIKGKHDKDNFTIHDLRRTARTHLAALKVPPHIAEKCLNHKVKGVGGTYDRHDYFNERRDALTLWSELLEACEAGQEEMTKWWAAFEKRKSGARK